MVIRFFRMGPLVGILGILASSLNAQTIGNSKGIVSRTYNVPKAGQLKSQLSAKEASNVTHLFLSGRINARDFQLLRDSISHLEVLDLSNVNVATMVGKGGTSEKSFILYVKNSIPEYAFCSKKNEKIEGKQTLREVWIPNNTFNIEKYAFADCRNLHLLISRKKTAPNLFEGALNDTLVAVFVPLGCKDVYRNHKNWAGFNLLEGLPVRCHVHISTPGTLGDELLKNGNQPSDVNYLTVTGHLNETDLKLIRDYMPKLVNVDLGDALVKVLPDYLFSQKHYLMKIVLPRSLEKIGRCVFSGCSRLYGVLVIPSGVTEIDEGAFLDCDRLAGVEVTGRNLTTLGGNLFRNDSDKLIYK